MCLVPSTFCGIGSKSAEFKVRFRNYKSSMLNNNKTCELVVHIVCVELEITKLVSI